ncbi:hypothetical protein C3747_95g89 [Trypanosoma cruzi]|uniref:C2H2-type domain-containing protein n=2 Tax=Trypanosoma cruzi TaxID=5693 RepID=Q4DSY2_TRYCC|nr:hypothetical protein, conserved [Trypanosoma cruzi]EAN95635.1 hypothetical protein, conserved [Trypanosoma cruzi]KAF8296623.1 hypothetical protein TcYC6_0085810 [Trypanosoma cruzi]PWV08036.1 hypothetical protein C3747_95g89 [Trypanosoma cruzi]RNC60834.1 hypothetical protein TcCL_ESM01490 [Trypanosoma cruzi]|eukprot:XP_817486.1 hypothetical protein [Trypanosoma cruzi strain CL Brener]
MGGSDEAASMSASTLPTRQLQASSSRPAKRQGDRVVSLQCPHCPRVITGVPSRSIRTNYNRHLLTHTKERPYQCEFCLAQFTTSTNRRRHVLRLHPELITTWSTPTTAASSGHETHFEPSDASAVGNAAAGTEAGASPATVGFACRFCGTELSCKGSRTIHERRCSSRPYPPRVLPKHLSLKPSASNVATSSAEQTDDPADTIFLCPNCEQELSSRQQVKRHLRCYCPFREDAFASESGDDVDGGDEGVVRLGPRSVTKRSRRILSKRRGGSAERFKGRPRHEGVGAFFSEEVHSTALRAAEVLLPPATYGQSQTDITVTCPYDDCMATFASRTRWLAHVARRHPKELVQEAKVDACP